MVERYGSKVNQAEEAPLNWYSLQDQLHWRKNSIIFPLIIISS